MRAMSILRNRRALHEAHMGALAQENVGARLERMLSRHELVPETVLPSKMKRIFY